VFSGYAYLYDERLNDRKHDRDVSRLEAEISRRGLNGRVGKFALFRHARDIVADLVRSGAQTLVVVGDDRTLFTAISALGESAPMIGFLPILGGGPVSEALSIPKGLASVDIMAARFNETIDLGRIGERLFLSEIIVDGPGLSLRIDDRFTIEPPPGGLFRICNLGKECDARDGKLDVFIVPPQERGRFTWGRTQEQPLTRLQFTQAVLTRSVAGSCTMDGLPLEGERLELQAMPRELKIITGRRGRGTLA
jgi:diacylglycerol kinase family enzyme